MLKERIENWDQNIPRQLISYTLIGLLSNGILYGLYLLLARFGLSPKTAVTLIYLIGISQTFFLNRKFTFSDEKALFPSGIKYFITYGVGYLLNLLALFLLVDLKGYSHIWVQGLLILPISFIIFILQKWWVFSNNFLSKDRPF